MPSPKEIVFPLAGLSQKIGPQAQPPYTTPDCLNVVPESALGEVIRGGSRSGFGVALVSNLAGPVRMLANLNIIEDNGASTFSDPFNGYNLSEINWGAPDAGWTGVSALTATYKNKFAYQPYEAGVVRVAVGLSGLVTDTTLSQNTRIYVKPNDGSIDGKYHLYVKLDNTTPKANKDGVEFILYRSDATHWKVDYVAFWNNGANTASGNVGTISDSKLAGWFLASVHGTAEANPRQIDIFWRGALVGSYTHNAALDANYRSAFGLECTTSGGKVLVDRYDYSYFPSSSPPKKVSRSVLIASGGGDVKKESLADVLVDARNATYANNTLGNDGPISAVQVQGDLVIADWMDPPLLKRTDCEYRDAAHSVSPASGLDEIRINGMLNQIEGIMGASAALAQQWSVYISAAPPSSGAAIGHRIVVQAVNGSTALYGGGALGYDRIMILSPYPVQTQPPTTHDATVIVHRSAKWLRIPDGVLGSLGTRDLDPFAGSLGVGVGGSIPYNQCPGNCDIIALYNDRLYLAGDKYNPHVAYASKSGYPGYFFFTQDPSDLGRAFPLTSQDFDDAPNANLPIRAMIPSGNDFMLMGYTNAIAAIFGDPLAGGGMRFLSHAIGVVSRGAWCRSPEGGVYFISRQGLFYTRDGNVLTPKSRSQIPKLLIDIDPDNETVGMVFDEYRGGLDVIVTNHKATRTGRASSQLGRYFVDIENGGFWPWKTVFASNTLTAVGEYKRGDSEKSLTLFGAADNKVYRFEPHLERDHDGAIDAYAIIGPIQFGDKNEARISDLTALLSTHSGDIWFAVCTGNSGEEALETAQSVNATTFPDQSSVTDNNVYVGTWSAGQNFNTNPMVAGVYIAIRIQSVSGGVRSWALEKILAQVERWGISRKLS